MLLRKICMIAVASVLVWNTSCVSKKKYALLQENNLVIQTQLEEAKAAMQTLTARLENTQTEKQTLSLDLQKSVSMTRQQVDEKDAVIQVLKNQIKVLETKINAIEAKAKPTQTQIEKKQKNSY